MRFYNITFRVERNSLALPTVHCDNGYYEVELEISNMPREAFGERIKMMFETREIFRDFLSQLCQSWEEARDEGRY